MGDDSRNGHGGLPRSEIPSTLEGRLREVFEQVADRKLSIDRGVAWMRDLPFVELGFAKVDHHRELRQGSCEIVYATGKTTEEVAAITEQLIKNNDGPILVTRAEPGQLRAVRRIARREALAVKEERRSRTLAILRNVPAGRGRVLILTAGTADLAVAGEAAITATVMGSDVELQVDVGVAGLHRIAAARQQLREADVVIVVAGMEGALASVIGGLVSCPVIACPTSVGYGASFGGLAALLSMLSSCTPGVVAVNIDDGVGAGYAGALIARHAVSGTR